MDKKKEKMRQEAYESLPPNIKDSLTPEEKEMFLTAEQWPDSLFLKLDEFITEE
ncbi:hypothetical protein [Desulfobacter hydrogenophilus]|uniref:hypothetical protein n=1 Tax=Desulfobacter hydrogenophilus TaxID=2291 RepID=UPI0013EF74D0|nr:hypothetical protein [Desulfobacter hydrogenophilus]